MIRIRRIMTTETGVSMTSSKVLVRDNDISDDCSDNGQC